MSVSQQSSESVQKFLEEFVNWPKEKRDEYTNQVLDWIAETLIYISNKKNIIAKKRALDKIIKENKEYIERIPIIFIYAVKPEFRQKVARILRIINGIVRTMSLF